MGRAGKDELKVTWIERNGPVFEFESTLEVGAGYRPEASLAAALGAWVKPSDQRRIDSRRPDAAAFVNHLWGIAGTFPIVKLVQRALETA